MANQNGQRRGFDSITILCGGVSLMGTLPLAPKVMNATADMTYQALASNYGPDLASLGMILHAGACLVVTYFGLLLALQVCLRITIQKIGRFFSRSGPFN